MKSRTLLSIIAVVVMCMVLGCEKGAPAPEAPAPAAPVPVAPAPKTPTPAAPAPADPAVPEPAQAAALAVEPEAQDDGPLVQKPLVVGKFYTANADKLDSTVRKMIEQVEQEPLEEAPFGFMVPHAGMIFSGPVAARAYKAIQQTDVKRFVIIAPAHHVNFEGVYAMDKDFYETPLGRVRIDRDSVKKLTEGRDWISTDPALYVKEHSLEVQLPFLQTVVSEGLEIVPLIIGDSRMANAQRLAAALNQVFAGQDVIYLASSDMGHGNYPDYRNAKIINAIDKLTLSRIKSLDVRQLDRDLLQKKCELCGAGPVISLMTLFRMNGGEKIKVLKYGDSGDAMGDKSAVVGYASVAFMLEKKTTQ